MDIYHLTSAQDNVTGEYRQVDYMRIEDETSRMNQIWLLGFIVVVMAIAFIFLARNFGKLPAGFRIGIWEIVVGIIVIVATLVTQAWMYSLLLRRNSAKPKFAMFRNNVIAYVSTAGYGLRRNSVIVTALTPLILLTGLALHGCDSPPFLDAFSELRQVSVYELLSLQPPATRTVSPHSSARQNLNSFSRKEQP